MRRLGALAVATGVPTAFGITTYGDPHRWQELLALLDDAARDGARMWGQSSCRPSGAVFNFATWLPFDKLPAWAEVRAHPLDEQARLLRQPDVRRRLVEAVAGQDFRLAREVATTSLYERIVVLDSDDAAARRWPPPRRHAVSTRSRR